MTIFRIFLSLLQYKVRMGSYSKVPLPPSHLLVSFVYLMVGSKCLLCHPHPETGLAGLTAAGLLRQQREARHGSRLIVSKAERVWGF